ncbi:MAG: efflux RND transporter periplasmic adaptor subunit [Planctomycetales bacterium]|nr:efflux RND transporter periplasmic adaptor subunit [Planctomycetales bacterium]
MSLSRTFVDNVSGAHDVAAPRDTTATSSIHALLLRAAISNDDADCVRTKIREVVKNATSASMVFHVVVSDNGNVIECEPSTEQTIREEGLHDSVKQTAVAALTRNAAQIRKFSDGTQQLICAPIQSGNDDSSPEVLAVVLADSANLSLALNALAVACSYQRLWLRGQRVEQDQFVIESLAAIVDLVSTIEGQVSFAAAVNVMTNVVAKHLGCARVAFAEATTSGNIKLRDISGLDSFDDRSETSRAFREAIAESQLHCEITVWPAEADDRRSGLLAHAALARQCHFQSICSTQLCTPDGILVGALLIADSTDAASSDRTKSFVRAASPRIASAIAVSKRSNASVRAQISNVVTGWTRSNKTRIILAIVLAIFGLMLLPLPYRIRCRCSIEPNSRRYAVSPFDGIVEDTFVEPGDIVKAGDLLAKMDGREIQWELSSVRAELAQVAKQRDVELADRAVTKVLIAQLETQRLNARIDALEYRQDHLNIEAAMEGIVLSGSLEKSQSAPVEVGQVLYEIGPLDDLRIEVEIRNVDIAQVEPGQRVKVWIEGIEGEPIVGSIEQIAPRSELRNDANVFIAKLSLKNDDRRFRPGMRGSARIIGPTHPLAWNLFHKPWQYAMSRLTWW